jgi:hypothetical protein
VIAAAASTTDKTPLIIRSLKSQLIFHAGTVGESGALILPQTIPLKQSVNHVEELKYGQGAEDVLAQLGVLDHVRFLLIVVIKMPEYFMVSHLLVVKVVHKWKILNEAGLRVKADLQVNLGDDAGVLLDVDVTRNGPDLRIKNVKIQLASARIELHPAIGDVL